MSDDKSTIRERILANIDDSYDKTEGSLLYVAVAPAAIEFEKAYKNIDEIYVEGFLDTATGEKLDQKAKEIGFTRKSAIKATTTVLITGTEGASISKGNLVSTELANYAVTEDCSITSGNTTMSVPIECLIAGTIGNVPVGAIKYFPVTIPGLTNVINESAVTNGYVGETDDEFRARVQSDLIEPAQDGNGAQYSKWATEYNGVGAAKVFPLWNGGNTVKVSITDSNKKPAGSTLIAEFQNYIDPGAQGLGNGVAPIGSKVTITGGTQKDISVIANVVLSEGYTEASGASDAIESYLASVVYKKNSVSYIRIGSALLERDSISELSNLQVNSGTGDVSLTGDEIPVLISINLVVVP